MEIQGRGVRSKFELPAAVAAILASGVIIGALAYARGEQVTRVTVARPPAAPQAAPREYKPGSCLGGAEPIAKIHLLPDAVVTQSGRQWVEYHGEVRIHRGTNVGVAWDADVLNDRGQIVMSKLISGSARSNAGETVSTKAIVAQLNDGFYAVRVRAAITSATDPSDVIESVQHVQVSKGQWKELTDIQWRERSRATIAFSEAEIAGRGL